jgi:hypothetical protein
MKDTILSILRHALTFGGGLLVAKGFLSDSTVMQLAAAVPTFAGLLWGAIDEYLAAKKAKEAAPATPPAA